ncbi:MAG: hypothetical protein M1294_01875 [Firmicutes bacterium]|jgi:hypothetical protein|uniref:Uncharacterized protein n=1 Tax=Sulfobacillus benefaciens TaxID=453960 RepID=A0A2T2XAG6_9FIRM|nr:hypothetical protein [Bacillota bacterium]MCL5014410.1 hypothetical protein [Bacillota bacterium]PSR31513.1 MAG: hypothetical protein C7B43_02115 [Sulfobacillus benefaciens]
MNLTSTGSGLLAPEQTLSIPATRLMIATKPVIPGVSYSCLWLQVPALLISDRGFLIITLAIARKIGPRC